MAMAWSSLAISSASFDVIGSPFDARSRRAAVSSSGVRICLFASPETGIEPQHVAIGPITGLILLVGCGVCGNCANSAHRVIPQTPQTPQWVLGRGLG